MKKFYWLLFSLLFVSCSSNDEPSKVEDHDKKKEMAYTDTVCRCSYLILDEPYNHFYHEKNDRTEPFTGICRDSFSNGNLKITKHLKEGKNHGIYKTFYKNGQLKSWKKFKMNYEVEGKNYFPTGVLKYHAVYKNGSVKDIIYTTKVDSTVDYSKNQIH